ncbi:MAG: SDR family oxidoreductase [Gordonia sp. (in: high G+C Gram-positive bacteria)]
MEISGKVAVVTGAGGGIGGAVARALADRGARVVLTDLNPATVTETAAGITAAGGAVLARAGDAADAGHIDELIEAAGEAFGPVDLYVANAGVGGTPGLDATDAEWQQVIDINLMAHVRAARRLVPEWLERGEGYFLSTASAAGLLTQLGSVTYATTKHAAVGFAEWLSATYGDRGIRVSCLCPMGVDTELLRTGFDTSDPQARLAVEAVRAAGNVLSPDDVATVVLAAIADEHFLILPHPDVLDMYRHKGADYDRWLRGMRRYQAALQSAD